MSEPFCTQFPSGGLFIVVSPPSTCGNETCDIGDGDDCPAECVSWVSAWQNPENPFDVNADTMVSPLDALLITNEINANGPSPLPEARPEESPYYDVSGDGWITPLDALLIINFLNGNGGGG